MTSPAPLPSPRGQCGFYLTQTSPVSKSLIQGWGAGRNCHPLALVLEPERVSVWVHFPSWRILAIVNLWGSVSLPVNHTYRIVGITQCTKKAWLVPKGNCSHLRVKPCASLMLTARQTKNKTWLLKFLWFWQFSAPVDFTLSLFSPKGGSYIHGLNVVRHFW